MELFTPLFQAVIAFCAVFTALGLMFNILLKPVKENMARLEKDLKNNLAKLESNQARLESNQGRLENSQGRLENSQARLENNQAKLEKDLKTTQTSLEEFKIEVNTKLDRILAKVMA